MLCDTVPNERKRYADPPSDWLFLFVQSGSKLSFTRQSDCSRQGKGPWDKRGLAKMKVVALVSGGKDSWYNAMHCSANGHTIIALANLRPPTTLPGIPDASRPFPSFKTGELTRDEIDSFMYQTVGHDVIPLQAECMALPLCREYITGQSIDQSLNYTTTPNDETEDLFRLLSNVKRAHPDVRGVSVGAILSNYQRARVENVCVRLGLTCLAYLWQRDQKDLLAEMIENGLVAVVIKVAAIGISFSARRRTLF